MIVQVIAWHTKYHGTWKKRLDSEEIDQTEATSDITRENYSCMIKRSIYHSKQLQLNCMKCIVVEFILIHKKIIQLVE